MRRLGSCHSFSWLKSTGIDMVLRRVALADTEAVQKKIILTTTKPEENETRSSRQGTTC
ncbi:MAG: hypothetical protein Q3M24_05145 [Candidatus Electrothrix aestuarii]|uniref:Uncharacterized protein n=1 Tax=Candidatus Electrothrix aestuarii TaxID=3062594 RepID=A0AAU8M1X4_9BACT